MLFRSRASVFVLSSDWEGLPGVLVQAMACGAPVVSTDCPSGPAEILENGKWGHLVPCSNAAALTDAMIAVLDKSADADAAKRAADFGADRAVNGYLEALSGTAPGTC